ncbi:MAG: hypothetical protein H0X13_10370 [Ramlibacter sp.]|nr:hypothetical protein [Ramlibacter sp.]
MSALISGRDLAMHYQELAGGVGAPMNHPLIPWAQRAVSLFLLLVSGERILDHFPQRKPMPSAALAWVFGAF